jgi:hypothetical protein
VDRGKISGEPWLMVVDIYDRYMVDKSCRYEGGFITIGDPQKTSKP